MDADAVRPLRSDLGEPERIARIFICSTFDDLKAERQLISNVVMPELRSRAREIDVEVVPIDLRWGIPSSLARNGGTVVSCLREVDRCSHFVGLIGDRYGWIPRGPDLPAHGSSAFQVLSGACGDLSMTHLEVRQWLAGGGDRCGRMFCFRRRSELPAPAGASRIDELVGEISSAGVSPTWFCDPKRMADQLLEALWLSIAAEFPLPRPRTPLELRSGPHDHYARLLCRDVVGRDLNVTEVSNAMQDERLVLVGGPAGIGKSAVFASALRDHGISRPDDLVICRFADRIAGRVPPWFVARDVVEALSGSLRASDIDGGDPGVAREWLHEALASAGPSFEAGGRYLVIGLDWNVDLQSPAVFDWVPRPLPHWVRLLVTVGGSARDAEKCGAECKAIDIAPLGHAESIQLVVNTLGHSGKRLSERQLVRVGQHPDAGKPAFIRAVVHRIAGIGSFRALPAGLSRCLRERNTHGVLQLTLASVERRFGRKAVHQTVAAVLASGEGMSEWEIVDFSSVSMATWVGIRNQLQDWMHIHDGVVQIRNHEFSGVIGARHFRTPDAFVELCCRMCEWRLRTPPSVRGALSLYFQSYVIPDRSVLLRTLGGSVFGPWIICAVPISRLAASWVEACAVVKGQYSREFAAQVLDGAYESWSAGSVLGYPAIPIGRAEFDDRVCRVREAILAHDSGE
jgi:hypothetical protein